MRAEPSIRASIIEARTYLRPLDDQGTVFETPEQAADRIIGHQRWLWERAKGGMSKTGADWQLHALTADEEAELMELRELFLDRKVTFSGRARWLGGMPITQVVESTGFNCAGMEIRSVHDVVDALWLLLQGCGVGFRPVVGALNGFTNKMEVEIIRSQRTKDQKGRETNVETFDRATGVWTIGVGDSAHAWAKSIGKILGGKFPAKKLIIDFSEVRGAGGRLRNYGWISSGDEQIARAYTAIAEIMNNRAGQLLTRIDILDVMNWLGMILSSRRSAQIALTSYGEPEWQEFAVAKKDHWSTGNPQRAMSNNSLLFYKKPTRYQLRHLFKLMEESGGSEPGFINMEEAQRRATYCSTVNPCVPYDTPILTRGGYMPIGDTVGTSVDVWNGERWSSVTPFATGVKDLYRVTLSDGRELTCTDNHEFIIRPSAYASTDERRVKAIDLKVGDVLASYQFPVVTEGSDYSVDAYSQGFYSGDGTTDYTYSYLYDTKYSCASRLIGQIGPERGNRKAWRHGPMLDKAFVPINGSLTYRLNWLAGLLDADGTVTRDKNGAGFQVASVDVSFLKRVQLMLTTLGVRAKVCKMRSSGAHVMPDGRGGTASYHCQEAYRILIGNTDAAHLMERGLTLSRLEHHGGYPQRDARRFVTVVSVDDLGEAQDTYCFTEPMANRGTFNGIVTGQCGEILLPDRGFCCLVETNLVPFNGDEAGLHRAHYLISRANYRATCVDFRDGVLQEAWHQNNQFLHLCGAGVTGVVSWEHQHEPLAWIALRAAATEGANSMADELHMPRPKNVTTVKPSGSASKVAGTHEFGEVPEGLHKPLGRFIFNNIRFSEHDSLVTKLRAANYHTFPDPYDPTGVLVRLPVEFVGIDFDVVDGVEVNLESAVAQLERYKVVMEHYVDNNASITVSYDLDEVPAIIDWLMENWDSYVGVSFIYRNDPTKTAEDLGYPYLPQQPVTRQEYDAYVSTLLSVSLADSAAIEMLDEPECAGGACPIR